MVRANNFALALTGVALSFFLATESMAQNAKAFQVGKAVEYETGDSWKEQGKRYRLYGVQSCLRGTPTVDSKGKSTDCGNVSLARLAAIFSSAQVSCQPIATARDNATFVVCGADMNGTTIDIGTALISTGYAFAATDTKGTAINTNYLIAELDAKMKQEGLWATKFDHPVQFLLKQVKR